jgi:type II secretory pathway pseudopilin PulG
MLSLPVVSPTARRGPHQEGAFTLVEVLVSTILIGLVAGSIIWGLNMLHHRATVNRLYTQAQTICQNRIDKILTAGPFTPLSSPAAIPDELKTVQVPLTVAVSTAPGNPVSGTMTTTITDTTLKYPESIGTLLNIKQAKVRVEYNFRGKLFFVEMHTLRAPDQ